MRFDSSNLSRYGLTPATDTTSGFPGICAASPALSIERQPRSQVDRAPSGPGALLAALRAPVASDLSLVRCREAEAPRLPIGRHPAHSRRASSLPPRELLKPRRG